MTYKEKIKELLARKIITTSDGLEKTFSSKRVATLKDINSLEANLKLKLPPEYVDFLLDFNGLKLFMFEDIGGVLFFDVENILTENNIIKRSFDREKWDNSIVSFCRFIGEGNHIGFRIINAIQYDIIDCFHENLPSEWKTIDTSLSHFLEDLIKAEGEKFWLLR